METLFWKHLTKISNVDKFFLKNREPEMLLLLVFFPLSHASAFKELMESRPSINIARPFKHQSGRAGE